MDHAYIYDPELLQPQPRSSQTKAQPPYNERRYQQSSVHTCTFCGRLDHEHISLVNSIRGGLIKHRSRNVAWCGQVDLPYCLSFQPVTSNLLRNLCSCSQLFDRSKATPIATWRVVDLLQLIAGGHQR